MANICDYVTWRQDLSFDVDPFNEVDSLILACFIYAHYDNIIKNSYEDTTTIASAINAFLALPEDKQVYRGKEDLDLLNVLKDAPRFKDLKCFNYKEIYEHTQEVQFAACTIELDKHHYCVVYRGTDNFVAGWKEDLNLSFKIVPAQHLAVKYLKDVISHLGFNDRVIVSGHSKGGNLAVYAAAYLSKHELKKVEHIYNHDGPGFDFNQIDQNAFENLIPLLTTFTPEMSFVGNLMNHVGEFNYIKSSQSSFMQHNPYSWEVLQKHFIRANGPDKSSLLLKNVMDNWLKTITYEEREKVLDAIYELIKATGAVDLNDIPSSFIKNFKEVQKVYENLDEHIKEIIGNTFSKLSSIFSSSMLKELSKIIKKPSK